MGLALAGWFCWITFRPIPLTEPQLVASTTTHDVINVYKIPKQIVATHDGRKIEIPGKPAQFLIANIRDGKLAVGWGNKVDDKPVDVVELGDQCNNVESFADRSRPGILIIKGNRGFSGDARVRLEVQLIP